MLVNISYMEHEGMKLLTIAWSSFWAKTLHGFAEVRALKTMCGHPLLTWQVRELPPAETGSIYAGKGGLTPWHQCCFAQAEVIEALPPFSAPVGDYVFLDA